MENPMINVSDGKKYDQGKLDLELFFRNKNTIDTVTRVLMYGAQKYDRHNWRHVSNSRIRYFNAGLRHIFQWLTAYTSSDKSLRVDPETGISHLAHAICCFMFLLELESEGTYDEEFW